MTKYVGGLHNVYKNKITRIVSMRSGILERTQFYFVVGEVPALPKSASVWFNRIHTQNM